MLRYKCCIKCYNKINRKDKSTAKLWPELCKYACLENDVLRFRLEHCLDDEFYTLETMGFILSHETEEMLFVRVNGKLMDRDLAYAFCIDIERHGTEV